MVFISPDHKAVAISGGGLLGGGRSQPTPP